MSIGISKSFVQELQWYLSDWFYSSLYSFSSRIVALPVVMSVRSVLQPY